MPLVNESRREAASNVTLIQAKPRSGRVRTNKGREASFVSEFLSRNDRDRRERIIQ